MVGSSNATIASLTALWGVLARLASTRIASAAAGLLILATPLLLLPRRACAPQTEPAPV